jgi:hypothetical protein
VGYRAVNAPLAEVDPDRGYRLSNVEAFREHGSVSIYLAFSGGGTRAAAFAYGVLETLRDQQVLVDGRPTRLLDKVDTLSGVSGGSFPAAYYGLFGDRIFDEFESRFLRRNIEGAIIWRVFWPWNAVAFLTPWMNRSDIAKGIYQLRLRRGDLRGSREGSRPEGLYQCHGRRARRTVPVHSRFLRRDVLRSRPASDRLRGGGFFGGARVALARELSEPSRDV